MRTFAYTKDSLENLVTQDDRIAFGITNAQQEREAISRIQSNISNKTQPYSFKIFTKDGREMCKPLDFETEILIRKVNKDFSRLTNARVSNRIETISSLRSICSEGLPMTIIRLDIKKFYRSVDTEKVFKCANEGVSNTYALRRNIESYLNWSKSNIKGVPTGISLSTSLTEYYLREKFDKFAISLPGVNFIRRYVDDIILVCSSHRSAQDYIRDLSEILPDELEFNTGPDKHDVVELHSSTDRGNFNYLGYSFSIGEKKGGGNKASKRIVNLDIAKSKIARRKKRFVLTLLQFLKDGNETDLKRRFLLLNSGYSFWDSNRGREVNVGLCNTYSEIDHPSEALLDLRNFYRSCMLNKKFQLYHRLRLSHLSTSTRRMIVALDLQAHVQDRKHFRFSNGEIQHLSSCWKK